MRKLIILLLMILPALLCSCAQDGTAADNDLQAKTSQDSGQTPSLQAVSTPALSPSQAPEPPLPHESKVPESPLPHETELPESTSFRETEAPEAALPLETDAPPSAPLPSPAIRAELKEQVEDMLSGFAGNWGVYFKNCDTGESFTVGQEGPMVAASLIKLFVYGAAYAQTEAGLISYDSYAPSFSAMITVSDNASCNSLIDAAGGFSQVNAHISGAGFQNTVLNRKMLSPGEENYTSARDCGLLLEAVLEGSYVSPDCSRRLLEALKSQTRTAKIPAGIPSGIQTANKTGELANGGAANAENDVAVVWSPACTYILCVMSSGISSGTAAGNIRSLSSAVYQYFNP